MTTATNTPPGKSSACVGASRRAPQKSHSDFCGNPRRITHTVFAAPPSQPNSRNGYATLLLALLLTGCASRAPVVIDSACDRFAVIYPSRQDTMETQRQILIHNRAWRAACIGGKVVP